MAGKLSPESIENVFQVVQMVFSPATNEDGEELQPRNWRKMGLVFPKVRASSVSRVSRSLRWTTWQFLRL